MAVFLTISGFVLVLLASSKAIWDSLLGCMWAVLGLAAYPARSWTYSV